MARSTGRRPGRRYRNHGSKCLQLVARRLHATLVSHEQGPLGRGVDLQSLLRRTGVPLLLCIAVLELASDASSVPSDEMWRFILLIFMRGLTGYLICSFIIRATLALSISLTTLRRRITKSSASSRSWKASNPASFSLAILMSFLTPC